MSETTRRDSAKIYQFPIKARALAGRGGFVGKSSSDLVAVRWPVVDCGGGWYHDAAIQDADRTRKS